MKIIEINDAIRQVSIEDMDLESSVMYWITANPRELQCYNDKFGFHSLTIGECLDEKQNAKLEFYYSYDFIVLNVMRLIKPR